VLKCYKISQKCTLYGGILPQYPPVGVTGFIFFQNAAGVVLKFMVALCL